MEEQIGKEIIIVSNRIKRRMRAASENLGLTDAQSRALRFIAEESQKRNLFQKDLEDAFDIRRSSVTQLLQVLERDGLVKREPVLEDARLKKLTLTEKGQDLQKIMWEHVQEMEKELAKNISLEEKEMFFNILYKVRKNLREEK